MKMIERVTDVLTGNSNMEDLHTIENFPVFMGCVEQSIHEDIFCEQTWQINRDTGVLQLKKLVPLSVLYQAPHANAVGAMWLNHHRAFSQFINKYRPTSILEIGGAHGVLSVEYAHHNNIPWTIVEPNPAPVKECRAEFIKSFFDEKFKYSKEFDILIHSHVFEHMYDPDAFMSHLSRFIPPGKIIIFSIPNMQVMFERRYTNCLNFEHTVLLSEGIIEFLLCKHGFRQVEKEYFRDDHSIFYAAVRDAQVSPIELPKGMYEKNKKLYTDYIKHHIRLVNELNNKMKKTRGPIYLFGAHIFSQFLIEMGLNISNVVCILDNDVKKHKISV